MAQKLHPEIEKILIKTILAFSHWLALESGILLNNEGRWVISKLGNHKEEKANTKFENIKEKSVCVYLQWQDWIHLWLGKWSAHFYKIIAHMRGNENAGKVFSHQWTWIYGADVYKNCLSNINELNRHPHSDTVTLNAVSTSFRKKTWVWCVWKSAYGMQ